MGARGERSFEGAQRGNLKAENDERLCLSRDRAVGGWGLGELLCREQEGVRRSNWGK